MQLSRNLFLSPRKALARKLEEMFISWQMERYFLKKYKKKDIAKMKLIEIYLNIVEFGPGVYGIKRGAMHFFAKTPMQLNVYEMAWLIRRLPRPRAIEVPKLISQGLTNGINKLMAKMLVKRFLPEELHVPLESGPWPIQEVDWNGYVHLLPADFIEYQHLQKQAALPKKTELASKTLNGIKQSPAQDGQDQKNTSPHK